MLYAILGLAMLMIVHETGHFVVARAFGMRVERFSIGFGPAIWRHKPRNSDTVYQVALIPFLAYVQIAGMNPFEEIDPEDKGSYANASLFGRIAAIIAGPLANYFFASIVFFASLMIGGKEVETTRVEVMKEGAAAAAQMRDGDEIVAINGDKIEKWAQMREIVRKSADKPLTIDVKRDGKPVTLNVTPRSGADGAVIGVKAARAPMPIGEAAKLSVIQPAAIVALTVVSLSRWATGKEEGQLSGPIGIMRETKKAADAGLPAYLSIVGFLSTSVGFFNMLPVPALDGGRLMFLGYEAITRRRPNQKVEAKIHAVGFLMLLAILVVVSFRELGGKAPSDEAQEKHNPQPSAAPSAGAPPASAPSAGK
jgi:regulator of sigma E protease